MRKILIFIGLKIVEILALCVGVGILYGLGIFVDPIIFPNFYISTMRIFFAGFVGICIIAVIFLIALAIYYAIKANWDWADSISKGKK